MMIRTSHRVWVGAAALLLQQTVLAADDSSLSFTFAPPPITSPEEQVSKLAFNIVSLEYDTHDSQSGAESTTEFTLIGLNFLTKNQGVFLSGGMIAGSDDTDTNSLTGLNVNVGFEGVSDSGFGGSLALGMNLLYLETDMTSGSPYFYSETTMTTLNLNLAVQQRIALGAQAGITPYIIVAYNMGGSGTTDTTIIASGYSNSSSTTFDVDPFVSTQIGFDIDIGGLSLAAMVQESDNSSLTSLNIGFEF